MRLLLSVLAYNLGNMWWLLGLSQRIKRWSLTSLQHRLMRQVDGWSRLFLAERYLNRRLFGEMLQRILALPVPEG